MKRVHRGKDKYKVSFELLVKKVTNLKEVNGSSVFISWRRGTKKAAGDTKRVIANRNEAVWEEKITFESKLFMDPKSLKFDEKKLSLTLKEDNTKKKSTVSLGKVSIDLSPFAQSEGRDVVTIPFVKGQPSKGPCLMATIRARPLKYNDKALVKVSSAGHAADRDSRLVKTIAGEDYYLDRTASEPSPTTLDTASVASGDDDDDVFVDSALHEPDQYSSSPMVNGGGAMVDELRRRIEDLSQQVEEADSQSFSRLATIREKEKEISTQQKEIAKLRRDKDELVEQLERLKKPAGKSEVDTLRAEAVDRLAEINNLEKEVDRLKKELSSKETTRERESRSDNNSNEISALKSRCTSLQQENERLTKLLRDKERERDKESSSNGRGHEGEGRPKGAVTTTNVVLSRDSKEDELRKQVAGLKQEMEEKTLLEKSIYCVEPQFRGGLPISATLILDAFPSFHDSKKDKTTADKSSGHTLTLLAAGMETAVKRSATDNAMLSYWLSTCVAVLIKLRKKHDGDSFDPPSPSTTSPVTRFEYSLTALASKIYGQLVRNMITRLEEELVGLLLHSHHMPRGTPLGSGAGLVLTIMNQMHSVLVDYHIAPQIATQLFTQIYYYINAVLFNCMLTPGPSREELCTCNSGFRIRLQLSRLEEWVPANTSLLSQPQLMQLREQLAPSVQASKLLVIDKKLLSDHEVFEQLCPVLSVAQIRRILTNFLPDALSPEPIPPSISSTLDLLERKERDKGVSLQSFEYDPATVRMLSLSFLSDK